jgi:ribA/ribD-fused uncharacterized protein
MEEKDEIRFFGTHGDMGFLSNFYPCEICIDGVLWPTVEHYYQAQKNIDPEYQEKVRESKTPGQAKKLGKKVDLRKDWDNERNKVMYRALLAKFSTPEMKDKLLETKEAVLVEDSPSDYFWGCGATETGQNRLGEMLMVVRSRIRAEMVLRILSASIDNLVSGLAEQFSIHQMQDVLQGSFSDDEVERTQQFKLLVLLAQVGFERVIKHCKTAFEDKEWWNE